MSPFYKKLSITVLTSICAFAVSSTTFNIFNISQLIFALVISISVGIIYFYTVKDDGKHSPNLLIYEGLLLLFAYLLHLLKVF